MDGDILNIQRDAICASEQFQQPRVKTLNRTLADKEKVFKRLFVRNI